MPFQVEFSPDAEDCFRELPSREQAIILDAVTEQLVHQPNVETRNRKPLRPNAVAAWELRVGDLRVYYDFQVNPKELVLIRAIGLKVRNRVRIGGKEVEL